MWNAAVTTEDGTEIGRNGAEWEARRPDGSIHALSEDEAAAIAAETVRHPGYKPPVRVQIGLPGNAEFDQKFLAIFDSNALLASTSNLWQFSRRREAALEAWEQYPHSPGQPMPVLFHAGFSRGVTTAQREAERLSALGEAR
jgi:hypothetical protein